MTMAAHDTLVIAIGSLIIGLVLLLRASDTLVASSSFVARRFGLSEFFIGATVVASGTSAPELFISINANLSGNPGVALGNVVGLQIWERIRAELPDVDEQFARGEFGQLHDWLREHVYRHGRKFTPQELLEQLIGGGMDAGPYVRYLRDKFGALAAA